MSWVRWPSMLTIIEVPRRCRKWLPVPVFPDLVRSALLTQRNPIFCGTLEGDDQIAAGSVHLVAFPGRVGENLPKTRATKSHGKATQRHKHCFSRQMRATKKPRKSHGKVMSKIVTNNEKSSERMPRSRDGRQRGLRGFAVGIRPSRFVLFVFCGTFPIFLDSPDFTRDFPDLSFSSLST